MACQSHIFMVACHIAMIMTEFSHHHPVAYQRMLVGLLVVMVVCGVTSTITAHSSKRYSFGELTLPLPAAPVAAKVQPASLKQLPGSDGSATPSTAPAATVAAAIPSGGDLRQLGQTLSAIQFGSDQWGALNQLWTRESNWNPVATSYSGACGIPQALPCSKMGGIGIPAPQQIQWGLNYIQRRYGTPSAAWQHELAFGWY
jgi:hypothetical protein